MMFYLMLSFSLTSNTQYNELITISSYVLLSYSALNFPIHTLRLLRSHSLRLLHSLSLTSQLTLYDFSTNSVSSIPLSFFTSPPMCSANTRGQSHVGLFYETIHLKGPTTHWWTRRRLGSRDIVYGSTDILGLFVHDTTYIRTFALKFSWEIYFCNSYRAIHFLTGRPCSGFVRRNAAFRVDIRPFSLRRSIWRFCNERFERNGNEKNQDSNSGKESRRER